jgi:hypothetical protein
VTRAFKSLPAKILAGGTAVESAERGREVYGMNSDLAGNASERHRLVESAVESVESIL